MNECEKNQILFFDKNTIKSNFEADIHISCNSTTAATKILKKEKI